MTYKILIGEELGFEYLKKIMDIDEEVYSDLGMEGALEQMEKRYRKNKETFVVLENAATFSRMRNRNFRFRKGLQRITRNPVFQIFS